MCNRKRIIALFLSLLMIFSAFPVTDISVFAEESEEDGIQSILDEREEKTAGLLELAEKARDDAAELVSDPFGSYSSPVSFFSLRSPAESVSEESDFEWEYDEETKTLTVSGSGAMPDYETIDGDVPSVNTPWFSYVQDIEKIVIEEGITSVGDFAFALCLNAKEVVLPEGITAIGDYAFAYCFSLKELNLPSTLISVGELAFAACWSVESLELPDGLEEIGDSAFLYMFAVESFNIPENIQYIGYDAFIYMTNLKEITVPAGVSDYEYSLYENLVYAFAIEKVVNNSSSAFFSDCVFSPFDSIEWAEIYSAFLACSLKSQFVYWFTDSFTETDLIVEMVDFVNSRIGTNYNAADFGSIEDLECILDIAGYHSIGIPNSYFSVECLNESAQHDYCVENKIMHKIIGEDNFCDCYVTDGTIGDNITWSIDTETKTLTIDGAGEFEIESIILCTDTKTPAIILNGEGYNTSVPAQIKDSGVYIPYEQNKSYDSLKFYHEWYYDEKTLYLVHGDNQMYFTEGKDFAVINGEKVKLAEPFFRYDSVPMLPLDILAKVCGFDVKIDGRFINING